MQDLDHLEVIWELKQEWHDNWDNWKVETFASLKTDSMTFQAQGMLKKLNKVAREVKVKAPKDDSNPSRRLHSPSLLPSCFSFQDKADWTICDSLKNRIETFKRTMPLIQDLKNPAMRDRHWTQLKEDIQKPFDHTSECSISVLPVK